ncbi:MAG: hypothetical protein IH596_14420 [Bacteroidales bacterium]|nr:hypothetical protein [Bacteroidales bacterium]
MGNFRQSLRRIPYWAYLLVLVTIFVNTSYFFFRHQIPRSGETIKYEKGYYIYDYIKPGSTVDKAGIRPGDTLVSVNSIPVDNWQSGPYYLAPGELYIAGILRHNKQIEVPFIVGSFHSLAPGFFWFIYIGMLLLSIGSLYILYKNPFDKSVNLFFISIQLFVVLANALYIQFPDPIAMTALMAFMVSSCFIGPILIHFHLLFPRPAIFLNRFKQLPILIYVLGFLILIGHSVTYSYFIYTGNTFGPIFDLFNRIVVLWMTLTFTLALLIAIFQFRTIKETLLRNQLRVVIIGAFFGFLTPMSISLFYDDISQFAFKYPHLVPISQGIGSLIMICCFLIAIFRYRIWDIEVFIRKALLYLGATIFILLSYLFLIFVVDLFTIRETKVTRFVILALSVIIFLLLRDRMQRIIDRIFHRETYDSTTVVSNFEAKLAGIYRFDELKKKIAVGLDEIFHFKLLVFTLKKDTLLYEPVCVLGDDVKDTPKGIEVTNEFEEKLRKANVFSPDEIERKPAIFDQFYGEIVVPLLSEDHPNGFFICGPKRSERAYSIQDIRVLSLLAHRVIALLHTANLYQKDLDRQLMLERERARISQDMHDDIGAGLTKIAMISEAPVRIPDAGCRIPDATDCQLPTGNCQTGTAGLFEDRLDRIASSSREMISRLNVIVWALNPKYDNLESLISYIRRYFGEYLEDFGIRFTTDFPEEIPDISITPDTRRNIFYAVQEASHNAVKHSGCSEISISVKIGNQKMEITIADNGKGFEQVNPGSGGNGLLNMRKRAEELGGSFEIQSAPGKGTSVIFNIEL